MIYWRKDDWQPAFRMWHDTFKDLGMNRQMATTYKNARKPKLHAEYANLAAVRANILQHMLQVALLQLADVNGDEAMKLPHVKLSDVEKLADERVWETMPENDYATHHVLTKLGVVMRARWVEPAFPDLLNH